MQEDMVQREGKALQGLFAVPGLELALPHLDDVPTHVAQLEAFGKVALAVALNLGLPEVGAGLGKDEVAAAFVAVPEAPFTKMTVRYLRSTMSGVPGRRRTLMRKRNPWANRYLRTRTSGLVLRLRMLDMHLCRCSGVSLSAMR